MNMTYETRDGAGIVHVGAARIDASVAIQFKDRFAALVGGDAGDVIVDMSPVEFLDSSGLGALVAARKQIGRARAMALVGLSPAVAKVMTLTRMDSVFPIHDDLDTALSQHAGAG